MSNFLKKYNLSKKMIHLPLTFYQTNIHYFYHAETLHLVGT